MRGWKQRMWIGLSALAVSGLLVKAQGVPAPGGGPARENPGVAAYARMQQALREAPAFVSGAITPQWAPDSQSFTYVRAGERHRFDVASRTDVVLPGNDGSAATLSPRPAGDAPPRPVGGP